MSTWIKETFGFHDLQRILFRLIERVEAFEGLTQQELIGLLEAAEKCTFAAGEAILRQGSSGAFLYIIIEGRVSVLKSLPGHRAQELAKLDAGASFGEMSLVDHDSRSATVIAVEPCVLLRLHESACWSQPAIGAKIFRNIARVLSRRLREMDEAFVLGGRR